MDSPFSLINKTIFVTGASSGIGRQVAMSFAKMGAKLIVTARNEHRLKSVFEELDGNGHQYFLLDINDSAAVRNLVDKMPNCDGMVHAAGVLKMLPLRVVSDQDMTSMFNTNLISPFFLVQSLLNGKKIRNGGSIVFISSVNGVFTNAKGFGAYGSSKAALNSIMKTYALEYAAKGIRFNTVAPGMIKTEMYNEVSALVSEKEIMEDKKKYPLGDYGEPEDVANACVFLISNASKWVTGSSLVVDGGLTIY